MKTQGLEALVLADTHQAAEAAQDCLSLNFLLPEKKKIDLCVEFFSFAAEHFSNN